MNIEPTKSIVKRKSDRAARVAKLKDLYIDRQEAFAPEVIGQVIDRLWYDLQAERAATNSQHYRW